ncbi:unnamed protein product [Calypogeia fissa]
MEGAFRSRAARSFVRLQIMILMCFPYVSTVISQRGFLSIDCGSEVSYCDSETGILWETDEDFISAGKNVNITDVPSDYPILNRRQVETLRIFDGSTSSHCYKLPVIPEETYLVRGTFFYGSLGNGSSPISFKVYVDNIYVAFFEFDAGTILDMAYDFEVIYSATATNLKVCLIRDQGPSFISALELRQLAAGMYADVVGPTKNSYLSSWFRINCGPPETGPVVMWRYPDDVYDRVWSLLGRTDNATHIRNPNISDSSNSCAQAPDRPPNVVMQDGWVYYDSNVLWVFYPFTAPVGPVHTTAYFQELDGNATATNVRGMEYFLNGNFIESFNSSAKPLEVHATQNITDSFVNMSFLQTNWSHLRPILNAFEIYQVLSLT